jgi:ABC-type cobalamin/Fe3+-siderophores transport system ATPase subunit
VLLREGSIIAAGAITDTLTSEALARLYRTPIDALRDVDGRTAFLPG